MFPELSVEDRAELIKESFITELKSILDARAGMSKEAVPLPGSAGRAGLSLLERLGRYLDVGSEVGGAARAARTLSEAEQLAAARKLFPGRTVAVGGREVTMPARLTRAAPGAVPPPRRAAPAAPEVPAEGPIPPERAIQLAREAGPAAAAADIGLLNRWRLAGVSPTTGRHFLIPALAGVGTGILTGSPLLGLGAGLGTWGLGRLGRIGRGPTVPQQAKELGEQAWREAGGFKGTGQATPAAFQEQAKQELMNALARDPEALREAYRAAAPGYLRGAAIAVPSAVGLGLWGGKKAIEGITDTGEGGGGLQNVLMSGLGGYGALRGGEYLAEQGIIPEWAKWPLMLGGAYMGPRVVGG